MILLLALTVHVGERSPWADWEPGAWRFLMFRSFHLGQVQRTKSQPICGVLIWTKLSGTVEVYTACSKLAVLKLDGLSQVVSWLVLCQLDTS